MDNLFEMQAKQALKSSFNLNIASDRIKKVNNDAGVAGKQFEAMFLTQMLEQVFASVKSDSMFGGGHAEDIYRSMLSKEYADQMSEKGGLGIASMVTKEIINLQEMADDNE